MAFDVFSLVEAFWLILPAYAANGLIPLARGKTPLDFGKQFGGRPLFGTGKTWKGSAFGIVVAVAIALLEMYMMPLLPFNLSPVPLVLVPMGVLTGLLLGLGTVIGDLVGSFIKRRIGIERGKAAPLLDQLDFVIGAFAFLAIIHPIKLEWVVFLLIITPVIHLAANAIGYYMGDKKVPY